MRHPPFRWPAGLLALLLVAGGLALHTLWTTERVAGQPPAAPAPAPARHWWDAAAPRTTAPVQQASATTPAPAGPTDLFRLKRDQAGDAKPVLLDADEIASWTEKQGSSEYYVFLLRGTVLAQQGIVQARFPRGVVWVDVGRYKITGKLRAELYAEGGVRVEDGSGVHESPRAVLDVTTRGEFKLSTHRTPMVKQTLADDPVVQRARAEGLGPASLRRPQPGAQPAPIQRVSHEERRLILPPTVGPAAPPTPPVAPAPAPNLQPVPPVRPMPPAAPGGRISYYAPPDDDPPPRVPVRPTAQPGEGPQPPRPDGPASGGEPRAPDGSLPPSAPSPVPPGTPPVPPPSRPTPPPPGRPVLPARNFMVAPRQGSSIQIRTYPGPNGETVYVITGGVILQVRNAPNVGMIDMEADRIVVWTRGGNAGQLATEIQSQAGHSSNDLEVYLSGHVVLRQSPVVNLKREERTILADEVYYDVNRNVAVAHNGRLELKTPQLNDPIVATAQELRQTSLNTFEMVKSEVFSSKLPSDPGLKVYIQEGTLEDRLLPQRNILGRPVLDRRTGQPLVVRDTLVTGNNSFFELEQIPFFWLPHFSTTVQEPLGPLQDFNFGYNHLFGVQLGLTLNMYQILGIQAPPSTRWLLNLDYLSYRGPGVGTRFDYSGLELFGVPAKYSGQLRAFGMYDRNFDILGGPRPVNNFDPPNGRGWLLDRTVVEDMPYGFSALAQLSPISDRNFVEQYYKRLWDMDPNLDTFLFLKQQQDNWAWSVLARPRLRPWVTMTQDLPRGDGWLIGQDFFKFITYTSHVNGEYAWLRTSTDPLPQVSMTDSNDATFRGSWMQEAQVPFYLGPLKLMPYGRWELTGYSRDLFGNSVGRSWEAGGLRASIPFTHLYSGVQSELFNVNGINHKIVASANYVYAYTNVPYTELPQLDRLNDDATNQALRDIRPYQLLFNPNAVFDNHGQSLVFSPYYNTPQTMAIRRLLFDRIDTLSTVEELQLQVSQRWQTKRGFPGNQHVVDWMVFDTYASYFPASNRDNFGHPWSFLQYNYLWNLGDRTAITSTGWTDPFPGGVRVWTMGGYFNRPDRTNFFLGFRYIDPLQVRAVTAAVTYVFSPKYAATASTTYDFGTNLAVGNSLMFTRMGSDLQVSLGVSYNSLQNNFGVLFNIVPNLLPTGKAFGPMGASGGGSQGVLK